MDLPQQRCRRPLVAVGVVVLALFGACQMLLFNKRFYSPSFVAAHAVPSVTIGYPRQQQRHPWLWDKTHVESRVQRRAEDDDSLLRKIFPKADDGFALPESREEEKRIMEQDGYFVSDFEKLSDGEKLQTPWVVALLLFITAPFAYAVYVFLNNQ
mmetsp:Transcript_110526/g.219767  ORF Transcript_110526/g.219767 Transcript_110526/m.219767 type:complete len:155 (-) Transcript_110526:252-716(-)|eukprot:CAMPEP_0172661810 /NCGR_PEP_ID=MMETSP1074-20121228/4961_1 /TAXON_ID=2916 /ORGANISM="Ceratium fusus, Strain PA161109" /LENGTH=154 /DNA_ID=CAMNT_0013477641 /DNA_START=56 /DNA_END=523 /DNA_ORIENTATION=+